MNNAQSSRNFQKSLSPQGGIVYKSTPSRPTTISPGVSTSSRSSVSFVQSPTWIPTMRQTATGQTDIQMKPEKNANAGHYLIIGAVVIGALFLIAKKTDAI